MFEVSDSKRVRREDLYESASEDESGLGKQAQADLQARLNAQLSGLLDIDFSTQNVESPPNEPEKVTYPPEESEEEALEFCLFSDKGPARTVLLKTQAEQAEEGLGDGSFVVPRRPISYYVAEEPDREAMERFKSASVSADYILQDAKRRRWGLEKPWKVKTITITSKEASSESSKNEAENELRKRPGKKRRIILRTREKVQKEKKEAAKKYLAEKEDHIAEKKKRLNRLKKLRRREKERQKKTTGKEGECAGSDPSSRGSTPE